MITLSLPSLRQNRTHLTFPSTLYLYPVLELLLQHIPQEFKPEIKLGLQEALVNAAKHGNQLDPQKSVSVEHYQTEEGFFWVISDEGDGLGKNYFNSHCLKPDLPPEEATSGRGLCILVQIFDQVHWNAQGTQLKLCKQICG